MSKSSIESMAAAAAASLAEAHSARKAAERGMAGLRHALADVEARLAAFAETSGTNAALRRIEAAAESSGANVALRRMSAAAGAAAPATRALIELDRLRAGIRHELNATRDSESRRRLERLLHLR